MTGREATPLEQQDRTLLDLVAARIRRLPEDGATKSRDYGRGYSQAVKDVLTIIERDTDA